MDTGRKVRRRCLMSLRVKLITFTTLIAGIAATVSLTVSMILMRDSMEEQFYKEIAFMHRKWPEVKNQFQEFFQIFL